MVHGISSGIAGIVTQPIRDTKRHGAIGVLSGIGKGVLGLISKPIVGVVDFAADISDGLKQTAIREEEIDRVRFPRYFNPGRVLEVLHTK